MVTIGTKKVNVTGKKVRTEEEAVARAKSIAPQGTPEQRKFEQGQRDIIMEGGRQVQNVSPQESQELALKQKEEIETLERERKLNEDKTELTSFERNQAAGQATIRNIGEQVGLDLNPNENPQGLQKFGQSLVGIAATTKIFGTSLGTILSPEGAGASELASDANEKLGESTRITRAATSKGADVNQAIRSLNILEEGIRDRYNKAQMQLRNSPQDVREGIDFLDEMSRDLRTVTENRQALERFKLTGDPNEILLSVGVESTPVEQ